MSTQFQHSPIPHLLAKPSFHPPFLTIPDFLLNNRPSTDNISESTVSSLNNLAHYLQDDIEFTNKDLEALDRLEEVLTQEGVIKEDHEKDLLRIKNNMENIMTSQHPLHIKVKLMGSMSECLRTKMNCIRECNKAYKEKILRLERAQNYMLALNIIRTWIKSAQIDVDNNHIDECLRMSSSKIFLISVHRLTFLKASNMIPFLTESVQTEESGDIENNNEEIRDSIEALEGERITHNKLEHVIVSLKQIKIPIMIAYENTKDDDLVLQNLLQERKAILEQKLRDIEDLKRKVTKDEVLLEHNNNNNKENIDPQLAKSTPRSRPKLREVYLDFEDKTQDMGGSRMALSTLSKAKISQKTPSKISQVFGKLFSGKKSTKKIIEKPLPTEELNVSEVYIPTV